MREEVVESCSFILLFMLFMLFPQRMLRERHDGAKSLYFAESDVGGQAQIAPLAPPIADRIN